MSFRTLLRDAALVCAWFLLCLTPHAQAQVTQSASFTNDVLNSTVTIIASAPSSGVIASIAISSTGTLSCSTYPQISFTVTRSAIPLALSTVTTSAGSGWTGTLAFNQLALADQVTATIIVAGSGCTNDVPLQASITYMPAAGICYSNPSACVTLSGYLTGANGLQNSNSVISLKPSQIFYVAGASNAATSSGGSPVSVNSSLVASPNFNDSSPPAGANDINVNWRFSGSNISAQIPYATNSTYGVVQPDNTTVTINNGILSAVGGGGGSVSSFGSGNLSPLFTTSVANATTTPVLSFALSNFAADSILGNFTGSSATPSTQAIPPCANDGAHALVYVSHVLTCELLTTGSGTVNSGTATHLGGYLASGTAISDLGSDFTFLTHTLTGGASSIFDLHNAATSGIKLPGGFNTGVLGVTTLTGAVSSTPGTADQVLGFNSSNVPAAFMSTPTIYASLHGILGNGSDEGTALQTLVNSLSPGDVLQLPVTGTYTKTSLDITLPAGVSIRGCGMEGNQIGTLVPQLCGLQFSANGTSSSFHIAMLQSGNNGLYDLATRDVSASGTEGMVFVGAGTPHIINYSCRGRGTTSNSDGSSQGTNDCIQFGSTGTGCVIGSTTSSYCGYGSAVVFNAYFANCKHVLYFLNTANGITANALDSDATCGSGNGSSATGYAIEMAGTSSGLAPYGNTIGPQVNIEMGGYPTFPPTFPNYKGAFGGTGYGTSNQITFSGSDIGSGIHAAAHGAYITTTNFSGNDLTCLGIVFSGGCFSDVGNTSNTYHDVALRSETIENLDAVNIGTGGVPVNKIQFGSYTVAALPSTGNIVVAWVADSANGSCTSGSGSIEVWCFWNGAGWVPMGNGSSPTFDAPVLGTATATSVLSSGIIDGTMPVTITTGTTASLGGTYKSGYTFNQEATAIQAVTYTLPGGTSTGGQKYCIANSNNGTAPTTGQLKLQAASPSTQVIIFTDGTETTSTGYLLSDASGSAAGDEICVASIDATHWQVVGQPRGTWTAH